MQVTGEPVRSITAHHDGFGLNESIVIAADEQDAINGGTSHMYTFAMDGEMVGHLAFQHGPRNVEGSEAGITDQAVLAVIIDRYEGFQAGPYACAENNWVLEDLRSALDLMRQRAESRAQRGVLGKLER